MSATLLADVANQVKKFWAPIANSALKQDALLVSLVNKDFEGSLEREGDSVYVSEIADATATQKQTGSGEDTFDSQKVSTTRVTVVANQVFTAAFELNTLVELQSQIHMESSPIRESLMRGINNKINDYLYSLVSPSSSAPDHILNGITDMNAAQLVAIRKLASAARWPKDGQWYGLCDGSYYGDLLNASTLASTDYVADQPTIAGIIPNQRFGFKLIEDNSDGLLTLGTSGADCGLFFHPSFLNLVLGTPEFKVSDLHSNKQHGYLISLSVVGGAALGVNGSKKHIRVYNT
jgi:hypothetical protein